MLSLVYSVGDVSGDYKKVTSYVSKSVEDEQVCLGCGKDTRKDRSSGKSLLYCFSCAGESAKKKTA